MPTQRVDYQPLPYVGERYRDDGYGRTLASLMQQRGDRAASLELQRGDIAAQGWLNAGNTIAQSITGWQRNVEQNRQRELDAAKEARVAEREGIQLESARMDLSTKKRATEGAEKASKVLPLARRHNGVVGYDRDLIQREMETAGHADLVPDIFKGLDEQEASHAKVIEARRDAIAGDAWRVIQGGRTDPETFNAMVDLWTENDLAPKRELDALRKVAEKDGVEPALMAAVTSSPRFAELLQKMRAANAPQLEAVDPEKPIIDMRTGEVFREGTPQPKTPANIEAAILQETDPAKRAELIALKEQFARAGRAPAQPVQPTPVQSKSLINDKGELVEGYFDPRARKYFDAQGNVINNPKPASTREQGRQVTSGDADDIATFKTSLDELAAVQEALSGNQATGVTAKVGAALPNVVTEVTGWGTDAKQKQATIDRVKQVIGKALEGGVLRKEDEQKYTKILPTIGDPPDVVAAKLAGLQTAIEKRIGRKLDSLADAGYDTSKFQQRQTTTPSGGPSVGERRTIQGQLAEWDGKGWKAVP